MKEKYPSIVLTAGAVALIASELQHATFFSQPVLAVSMIATDAHWAWPHLLQIAAVLVIALGFTRLAESLDGREAHRLRLLVTAGATLLIAALALGGDALKGIADAWAASPSASPAFSVPMLAMMLETQRALLDAGAIVFFGVVPFFLGMALVRMRATRSEGVVGMLFGLVAATIGSALFVRLSLPPLPWHQLLTLGFGLWTLSVGIAVWRPRARSMFHYEARVEIRNLGDRDR